MAQRLHAAGARTQIQTTPDHTAFTTAAMLTDLSDVLALERRRLEDPLSGITQVDLDAVLRELRTDRIGTGTELWEAMPGLLLPAAAAPTVDLASVAAYVKDAWAPGKTTITLTGDLSGLGNLDLYLRQALVDALVAPGSDAEGDAPPAPAGFVIIDESCGTPISDAGTEPPVPVLLDLTLPADVSTPQLALAWSLPGSWHEDHTLVEAIPALAERYIAEGFSSTAVPGTTREEIVRCELMPGVDTSVMTCRFPLARTRDAAGIERSAVVGLDTLWFPNNLPTLRDRLPDIQEGVRRNLLRRASAFADGEPEELMRAAAHARYRVEEVQYISQLSEVDDLEAAPLLKVARKWLNPDRAAAIVLTPDGWQSDHFDTTTDLLPTTAAWTAFPPEPPELPEPQPVPEGEELPEIPVEPVQPLAEGMSVEPLIAATATPQLDGAQQYTLDNGLSVIIVPRPGYPVVHATLVHTGGFVYEDVRGIDAMAWDLSTPFSPNKDQFVPEHPLAGQAWWSAERRPEGWVRTLSGPQPNLEGLLYILRQTTLDTTIDEKSLNEYFFRLAHQEPGAWTANTRLSLSQYFGSHRLGRQVPTKKALKKLIPNANKWSQKVVQPDNTTLILIGPVDLEGAKSQIDQNFSDWTRSGSPSAGQGRLSESPPRVKGAVVTDAPLGQAQVRMRCPASGNATTDLVAAMLEVRMWESAGSLRPDVLRADHQSMPGGVAWMNLYTEVTPSRTADAVALMNASMTDIVAEMEAILTERIVREAFDAVIAIDAERRRPRIDDATAVALLESMTLGTRPPEDSIKALDELMERLAEPEEADVPAVEGEEEEEPLSEEALALLTAARALGAEELEEEEVEEPDEDAVVMMPVPEIVVIRPGLDHARAVLAAGHAISMSTTAELRDAIINETLRGHGLENLTGYGQQLFDITEQDVIDEISGCMAHPGLSVLGPAATTGPQVTEAGFPFEEPPKKWWK